MMLHDASHLYGTESHDVTLWGCSYSRINLPLSTVLKTLDELSDRLTLDSCEDLFDGMLDGFREGLSNR